MEKRELSQRQKDFCEEWLKNGYNGKEAYKVAYGEKDDNTAKSGASKLLKKEYIRKYIEILEGSFSLLSKKMGIDKKEVLRRIIEMFNAEKNIKDRNGKIVNKEPDWYIRKTGIELFLKVTGYGNQKDPNEGEEEMEYENKDIVKLGELSPEQQEEYRKKLIKEM